MTSRVDLIAQAEILLDTTLDIIGGGPTNFTAGEPKVNSSLLS